MSTAFTPRQLADQAGFSGHPETLPCRYAAFGSFLLDLQRQELFKDGVRVRLQGKVGEALLALLEKPGNVVTREALRLRLWPQDQQVNYDANVNTTVNKLRQVLGDSPEQPAFVETIPRKGYSFVAKVNYTDEAPQPSSTGQSGTAHGAISGDAPARRQWYFSGVATPTWFRASIVALVVAGMLLGAAITLFAHRGL
jgi:DNA-binding winged helix-turn-helix (wHTH) protein